MSKIFDFEEVKEVLSKKHFRQMPLFRGESKFHPVCFPALARESETDRNAYFGVLNNTCQFIRDSKLSKFLTSKYEYVFLNDEPFGANDIIDPTDLTFKNITWGLAGLLQHYGFPTEWIDLTYDLDTALFFASAENESEVGYLYYCDNYNSNLGVATNLGLFAKDLRKIIPIPPSRPERQHAIALRAYGWMETDIRPYFSVIKFKKPKIEENLKSYYFPKDALSTWLKGMIIDYYFDYLNRESRFLNDKSILRKEDPTWYKENIELLITKFNLW